MARWEALPENVLIRFCYYSYGTTIFNKLRLVCKDFYTKLPLHNDIKDIYLEEKYIACKGNIISIIRDYLFDFSNGFFIWCMHRFALSYCSSDFKWYQSDVKYILYFISHGIMIMNEKTKKYKFQGICEKHVNAIMEIYINPQKINMDSFPLCDWLLKYYICKHDKVRIKKICSRIDFGSKMHSLYSFESFDVEVYDEEFLLWLIHEFPEKPSYLIKIHVLKNRFEKILKIYDERNYFTFFEVCWGCLRYGGHYDFVRYFITQKLTQQWKKTEQCVECLCMYYEEHIDIAKLFTEWMFTVLNKIDIDKTEVLNEKIFYRYALQYDCIDFLNENIDSFRDKFSRGHIWNLFHHASTEEGLMFLFNELKIDKNIFNNNMYGILHFYGTKINLKHIKLFFDFCGQQPNKHAIKSLMGHHDKVKPNKMVNFFKEYDNYIDIDTFDRLGWLHYIKNIETSDYIYNKFGKNKIWKKTIESFDECEICKSRKYDYGQCYEIFKRIGVAYYIINHLRCELQSEKDKCGKCITGMLRILFLCNRRVKNIKLRQHYIDTKNRRMCDVLGIMVVKISPMAQTPQ